jgi:hypothetical protein
MQKPKVVVMPIRPAEPELRNEPVEISFWMESRRHRLLILPPPAAVVKKAKIIPMPKRTGRQRMREQH